MTSVLVIADWSATYPDPITLAKDAPVTLTGQEDIWEGHRWLWAVAPDGRAGWVPDSLIRDATALRDYTATELSCRVGETLTLHHNTHGWAWCTANDGRAGWVPLRCLDHPKTG